MLMTRVYNFSVVKTAYFKISTKHNLKEKKSSKYYLFSKKKV